MSNAKQEKNHDLIECTAYTKTNFTKYFNILISFVYEKQRATEITTVVEFL